MQIHFRFLNYLSHTALKLEKGGLRRGSPYIYYTALQEVLGINLEYPILCKISMKNKALNRFIICVANNKKTDFAFPSYYNHCTENNAFHFRNMEVLDLMGLCDIGGNCLVLIPTTMPKLRLLDLSQCHQVSSVNQVRSVACFIKLAYFLEDMLMFCDASISACIMIWLM